MDNTNKIDEVLKATKELRETFSQAGENFENIEKKFSELDALDAEKAKKINDFLDTFEKKQQEELLKKQEFENKLEELKKSQKDIVEELKNISFSNNEEGRTNPELEEMFAKQLKFDKSELSAEDKVRMEKFETVATNNTIRTDINPKGGYTVHPAICNQIFKEAEENSVIEPYCSVFNIDKKSLIIPIDKDQDDKKTYFVNEAIEGDESSLSFEQKEVNTYRQSVTIPVTRDMLMFSDKNIISYITEKTSNKLGKGEARAILRGEANNEPEGLLSSKDVPQCQNATGGVLDFDDIISMPAQMSKSKYADPANSKYYFNFRTLSTLRLLKDLNGQYLWSPAVDQRNPNTINGFGYVIVPEIDDIAANKYPILFGDLKKGYAVVRNSSLHMIRDEFTSKRKAIIEYTFDRWVGGAVVLGEALIKLKFVNA